MRFRLFYLLTLLALYTTKLWSQETDTIYVQEVPLVIKKQVFIEDATIDSLHFGRWFVAIGYSVGKYNSSQINDSILKSVQTFSGPICNMGYEIKNWNISIGAGFTNAMINANYLEKLVKTTEIQKERYDTVGSYISIEPDGPHIHYTIDSISYIEKEIRKYDSTIYMRDKLSYWNIPLQVAYQFNYKKTYFQPTLSIIYHLSPKSQLFSDQKSIPFVKSYFSLGFGLQLGVYLSQSISLEIGALYSQQLSQTQSYLKLNRVSGNIGFKYLF